MRLLQLFGWIALIALLPLAPTIASENSREAKRETNQGLSSDVPWLEPLFFPHVEVTNPTKLRASPSVGLGVLKSRTLLASPVQLSPTFAPTLSLSAQDSSPFQETMPVARSPAYVGGKVLFFTGAAGTTLALPMVIIGLSILDECDADYASTAAVCSLIGGFYFGVGHFLATLSVPMMAGGTLWMQHGVARLGLHVPRASAVVSLVLSGVGLTTLILALNGTVTYDVWRAGALIQLVAAVPAGLQYGINRRAMGTRNARHSQSRRVGLQVVPLLSPRGGGMALSLAW